MTQAAREVLRRLDAVLAENAKPLHDMIGNLSKFSDALARNSDRLDGIVAGLERMTGGAAAKTRLATYDLTTPRTFPAAEKVPEAQLMIPDPTALSVLDSEKILTRSAAGVSSSLPDAQWSDTVPKLLQMKIIQAFENAGTLAGVSRALQGVTGDLQLLIDVRRFQIAAADATADVELAGKVLDGKGRIIDTRVFRATTPAAAMDAPTATAALDQAFGKATTELVLWTSRTIADQSHAAPASTKGRARGKSTRGRGGFCSSAHAGELGRWLRYDANRQTSWSANRHRALRRHPAPAPPQGSPRRAHAGAGEDLQQSDRQKASCVCASIPRMQRKARRPVIERDVQ